MSTVDERLLDAAIKQVAEAEQRRAEQLSLIREFAAGSDAEVCARRVLAEIERTLTIARTHRAILQSLTEE